MDERAERDFDVAVTFAGEQREFVEEVVKLVKADGFAVFYDEDSKADLWGEDLTEFFADVYERRSRYAVMFISAEYAAKPWTRLERRSVLARAMQEASPYLLPVRFDSTELAGVRHTVGHLDALAEGPEGIAEAIRAKLQRPEASGDRKFNGRVPRTDAEVAVLLGERPAGWEYFLFAYWLLAGIADHQVAYNDHQMRFAFAAEHVSDDEAIGREQAELARLMTMMKIFESLLDGRTQELALGAPGTPGDPELIKHLAGRMMSIYSQMIDWSSKIRGAALSSNEGRDMFNALADFVDQPIGEIRRFVEDFRDQLDHVSAALDAGEQVKLEMNINFVFSDEAQQQHERALEAFAAMLRRGDY